MPQLYHSLFEVLSKGNSDQSLIVTPNQRLALELRRGYSQWRMEQSDDLWSPLNTRAFDAWLQDLWLLWLDELTLLDESIIPEHSPDLALPTPLSHRLLQPFQELSLWETLIRDSETGSALLRLKACAKQAMTAHQLWTEWGKWGIGEGGKAKLNNDAQSADVDAFLEWQLSFAERCQQKRLLNRGAQMEALKGWLEQRADSGKGHWQRQSEIWLVGFEEFSPLQQALFEAVRKSGSSLHIFDSLEEADTNEPTIPELYAFEQAEAEWRAAAQWAGAQVEKGEKVAIVVPDLQQDKAALQRILAEELVPDFHQQLSSVNTRPHFNLSAGDPFSSFPLITTAVSLLEWPVNAMPLECVVELCNSPFLAGGEKELEQRALFKSTLIETGAQEMEMGRFKQLALKTKSTQTIQEPLNTTGDLDAQNQATKEEKSVATLQLPVLVKTLWQVEAQLPNKRKKKTHREWRAVFDSLLEAWGWPGERVLDSDEYQQHTKWVSCLDQFEYLDQVNDSVTYLQAVSALKKLLDETIFQAQSENQQLHVLGMLEALGQSFDQVWVVGLTDETWPAAPNPNPFIPFNVQAEHQFPRSTAERELRFSQRIMERLLNDYEKVRFSWPQNEGDKPLQPSALLKQWQVEMCEASSEILAQETDLESVLDRFIPLASDQPTWGGAGLLKAQSECPFKAFARYRLRANVTEPCEVGLNPAEKGELIHSVLEKFWQRCKTQTALKQLSQQQLGELISLVVEESLTLLRREDTPLLNKSSFLNLESERLARLAHAWLQTELDRPDFEVLAVEQKQQAIIAGLNLNLRIDRIDRLPSGQYLIIDYKTGTVSPKEWQGDQLREPQLPIYCLTQQGKVSAIAFAQVKLGATRLRALASELESALPEKDVEREPEWERQISDWDQQLQKLATDYLRGYAAVAPMNPNKDCQFCDYPTLCRIGEQS